MTERQQETMLKALRDIRDRVRNIKENRSLTAAEYDIATYADHVIRQVEKNQ